jgi:hypothetical protein
MNKVYGENKININKLVKLIESPLQLSNQYFNDIGKQIIDINIDNSKELEKFIINLKKINH